MADQQPAVGIDHKEEGSGHTAELTRLGGILLGLGLLLGGALNNQSVKLSNQVLPELPAPGVLLGRILVGVVGVLLLLWGLAGLFNAEQRIRQLQAWRLHRGTPKPPDEPGPNVGRPPNRNPLFTGREEELERLGERLTKEQRVDVSGLGGVGKSSLALEYLHREQQAQYSDGVFWLRGETAVTLSSDFAALAWLPQLRLEERELPEQGRVVAAVVKWLREHDQWLLVIDNLDEQLVRTLDELLVRGLRGHVIVTCRTQVWPDPLAVEPMLPEVAVRYLLYRSGQTDTSPAHELARRLDYLPLALEQAAVYMRTTGSPLPEYLKVVRTRLGEIMGLAEGRPANYPFTVATTWSLSFDRIEQQSPAAAALLNVCAYLAPEDIPVDLLKALGAEVGGNRGNELADEIQLDRAIGVLQRYSLVRRRGDGLRVHRLVQTVLRDRFPPDSQREWLAVVLRGLRARFPPSVWDGPLVQWPLAARLLPQVECAVTQLSEMGTIVEPQASCWLLDQLAGFLFARGDLRQARALYERALAIWETAFDHEDENAAAILNNLALLLGDQGELVAARPLYERALVIREQALGHEHPATAATLNNLAVLLRDQGELDAARSLFERALAIRGKVLGPEDPETAESLNTLGNLLRLQGDLAEARSLLERALAIRKKVLGPEHPYTATSLDSLGSLLLDQGAPGGARPLYECALAIRKKVLGPEHPATASSLNNLGSLLEVEGDLEGARSLYERALAIREKVLRPDHPATMATHRNLEELLARKPSSGSGSLDDDSSA